MIIDQIESIFVPNQVADRYWRQASEHFKKKRYAEALDCFNRALRLQYDSSDLYYNRGAVHANMDNYDAAVADFTTALMLKPRDPAWILFYRAQTNAKRNEVDAAIQDYADALGMALDLDKARVALEHRGHLLIAKKEWARAEKNFRELLRLDSKPNYAAQVGIGCVRRGLKDYEGAIEYFTQAILVEPQRGYAYFQRGFTYIQARNWGPALADFEEASRLNPASVAARNNCGFVRTHLNDLQDALADFKKALEIDAASAHAYIGIADIHFLLGEYELALENAQKAHELAPEVGSIAATLAVDYYVLKQTQQAFEIWRELIAKDENYGDADWVKQEHTWAELLVEEARKLVADLGE